MRTTFVSLALFGLFISSASAIPWPLGDGSSGWESVFPITRTYGNFDEALFWVYVTSAFDECNFHNAIDISYEDAGTENIRVVEAGIFRDCRAADSTGAEWFAQIFPNGSAYGWHYGHVQGNDGTPVSLDTVSVGITSASYGDLLGSMAEITGKHLHFFRTDQYYFQNGTTGIDNPLDYLSPEPTGANGYTWEIVNSTPSVFFLPQHDAIYGTSSWEAVYNPPTPGVVDPSAVLGDTLDRDSLCGAVDILHGCFLRGYPQGDSASCSGIPQRISWTLSTRLNSEEQEQFKKYVVDFDEEIGAAPGDWQEFRRFYFPFFAYQLGWYGSGANARIICLTNCGNAQSWAGLGISNIEEGCWNTALALSGTGENYNPILQDSSASDGFYRIDVTAYAWDTTDSQRVSIDCQVCNTREVAQKVVITDAATQTEVWRAEWVAVETANGFEPVKNVLVDAPADPGSTLDIEIVFTGPMDTSVEPFVRFAKAGGAYLVADPATVEWTSTNLPSGYYDTWHGTVDVPSSGMSGWLTMQIKAKDNTGLGLLDPSDADPDPPAVDRYEDYTDTHHGFGIAFGPEVGWDGELEHYACSSPVLADMDGDGDLDVGIGDSDGWVHLLDDDGTSLNGNWPAPTGWPGSFPFPVRISPAVVDLDGDGEMDVISTHHFGADAWDIATGADLPGWPVYLGVTGPDSLLGQYPSCASPVVGDADGDGELEVVICRVFTGSSNLEASVFMFEHTGGACKWACNLQLLQDGASVYATPAMCDVNGDGDIDVLVATADGYQNGIEETDGMSLEDISGVYLLEGTTGAIIWEEMIGNCHIYGAPVVADLEGDGPNEVIFGTYTSNASLRKVYILDGVTGNIEHSLDVPNRVMGPVGVGDLDEDGNLDIVAGVMTNGIYAWSGAVSHALLPGFPVSTTGSPNGGISIVDMDADFELEIVAGTNSGWLYAINPDGSICTGFPVDTGSNTMCQVAAGDIDGDGALELVGADNTEAQAWCYDMGSGSYPCEMPWRQFQHDSWHSGCFEADNTIPASPTDLAASVTYNTYGYTAELTWDLSVNDPYSGSPEEPADVLSYQIYRAFPPYGYSILSRTHAGEGSYTDVCNDPQGMVARYVVTSADGVNESEYSNEVRFRTVPGLNIALGCAVREEIDRRGGTASAAVGSDATSSRMPEAAVSDRVDASSGAWLLTDGETSQEYTPDADVSAVVIDLGRSCGIAGVSTESDGSSAAVGASSSTIEVSRDGSAWASIADGAAMTSLTGRYVRLSPAPSATEIFVWGAASEESSTASIGIERSDGRWNLELPVLDDASSGETGTLSVYDVTGRVLRSWNARPGEEVDWDGRTASGTQVTPGCYFVRYEQGGEAVTSRLLVTAE